MSPTPGIYRGDRGYVVQDRTIMWNANNHPLWKLTSRRPALLKRLQKRRATICVLEIAYVSSSAGFLCDLWARWLGVGFHGSNFKIYVGDMN